MSRTLNRRDLGRLMSACMLAPTVAAQDGSLLHARFQDHAVVQRDQPLRVWGHADPGAQVRVSLAGQRTTAQADVDGRWEARLPALQAGGPHVLDVAAGDRSQRVSDVLIGDVW